MGLSFTIAAGPRQRSPSQVRVSRDSWPHCTISDTRLPQPVGRGSRIYIPPEQGGPFIPPGTEFPFRRLLLLARLRWRYSTPPPHEIRRTLSVSPRRMWAEQETEERTSCLTPRRKWAEQQTEEWTSCLTPRRKWAEQQIEERTLRVTPRKMWAKEQNEEGTLSVNTRKNVSAFNTTTLALKNVYTVKFL
jgi:hypothetical protein